MAIVINGTGTIAGVSATGITTAPTNATDASKLPLAGGTLTGNVTHASNSYLDLANNMLYLNNSGRAKFGSQEQMQIYHDGSNSIIEESGTGALLIKTNGTSVNIQKGDSANIAEFLTDGAVKLYHDNVKTFETTATGVNIIASTSRALRTSTAGDDLILTSFHQTNNRLREFQMAGYILKFFTGSNGASTSTTEKMRIASDGKVGIGAVAPSELLEIKGNSSPALEFNNTSQRWKMGSGWNSGTGTEFFIQDKTDNRLDLLLDGTGNVELVSGNLIMGTAGKGIDFSANAHAGGMTSEVLDDYEEGNFTGTLTATSGTPNTAQTATGTYTKVGRLVTVNIDFNNKNTTGASGPIRVTGLPFQVGVNAFGSYIAYNVINYTANSINTSAQFVAGDTYITFVDNKDSGPWETSTIVAGNTMYLYISGTYYV